MESGVASDEQAPPCDTKRKDLTPTEQLKVISMLVAMEAKDSLRRGAIMVIAKKFGFCTSSAKRTHELGIINSPEFFHAKKSGRRVIYLFFHGGRL